MTFFTNFPQLHFGTRRDDSITTGDRHDIVFALGGDDQITTGGGNDRVFGGSGFDTALFEGSILDYDIRLGRFGSQPVRVTKTETGERDRLYSVEALEFDDYTLFLNGANNAALARDDTATIDEDTPLIIDAETLLANDFDGDGDTLSITGVSATSAAGASISFSGGQVRYEPAGVFDGLGADETAQDTFTYTIEDGNGSTDTARVAVTITGVNDAPVLGDAAFSVDEQSAAGTVVGTVTGNDAESDTLQGFAITGGNADLDGDGVDAFAIDAATGAIMVGDADDVDFETQSAFQLLVAASDGTLTSAPAIIDITLNDIVETPEVNARINEIHYDNSGGDVGEFLEIRTDTGDDVSQLRIELYNGTASQRSVYAQVDVAGLTMTSDGTYDYYVWRPSSIQNGSPDGVALSNGGDLIEFLSYEGTFEAADGTAAGITSTDIGPSEDGGTPVGFSLQRNEDGSWRAPEAETPGAANEQMVALDARINEFHYDNSGTDENEFIEIRTAAGAEASMLSVELYNGNGGALYDTLGIAEAIQTTDGTYDYYVFNLPTNGLQNGAPDGIALVNDGSVVEFLSYEGSFTAAGGTADGQTSTDIGVSEPGDTPVGSSLQRSDDGETWALTEGTNTSGAANDSSGPALDARINELHYDNDGGDVGEFIEIRVTAGGDVSGLLVELYNGSNGTVYNSLTPPATPAGSDVEYDYYVLNLPANGLQNGAPDGLALSNNGTLIEFLSYEGTFTGVDGAASGITSTDIGQQEGGSTAIGDSLQRNADDSWDAPRTETKGAANEGDGGGGPGTELTISAVQGVGDSGARVGETVTVEAIVIGDFQDGDADEDRNLRGFFLQEETADQDGDAETSEGIFVFEGTGDFIADVALGDRVQVTGIVSEFFGQTQIVADTVTVTGAGAVADVNTLAQTVNLDTTGVSPMQDGEGRYVPDLEAYEGMLVTITDTLTVNELFQLDRFNEMRLSANGRPEQFTQSNEPDQAAFDAYQQQIGSDQIFYDDGLNFQNAPILEEADTNEDGAYNTDDGFSMGDTITGLTGVLTYTWAGNSASEETWRIRAAEDDANNFADTNTREATPPDVGGTLTVASFNVLNFFTTLDVSGNPGSGPNDLGPRGADSQNEFDRQLDKLVTTLTAMDADIFGLVELENEFGSDQNGDGVFAIQSLVDALNTEIGSIEYAYVDPGRGFVDTGDAISVGMIYKPDVVTVNFGSVEILDDSDLDGLGFDNLDDDGIGVFDGVNTNRAPLAATFTENSSGEDFTVAVTHMKSKGGSGTGGNADQNDGAGNFNEIRTEGVQVLTSWLDAIGDRDGIDDADEGDILVLGDFNAYAQEDPITTMLASGYMNLEAGGADTFVFDGQSGTLDYAFANGGIFDNVTSAAAWHINSPEADAIDYNLDFSRDPDIFDGSEPYRASDHDPLLVGLDFNPDDMVLA